MKQMKKRISVAAVVLIFFLAVYLGMICAINFFAPPSFYDSDMYTDIRYAMESWNHKSVFPEGWVFGNQLYVISTPVLAALFYGLTGAPAFSMGLASTVMAVLVLLSFFWMMEPVIPSREGRLAGVVLLVGIMLFFGDAWHDPTGWQLMFTMCSYYACYAVNAFLAYGCYLRSWELENRRYVPVLVFCCVLSFATGMQSLRQTAVMTLPLLGVTALDAAWNCWRRQPVNRKRLLTAGLVSLCNVLGLVAARCMDLEQVEIIGELKLVAPSGWIVNLKNGILLMLSLILNYDPAGLAIFTGIVILCAAAVGGILKRRDRKHILLAGLLMFSVLSILAVDTLTTMQVRSIYYFMLYPLTAFLAARLFSLDQKWIRQGVLVFVTVLIFLSWGQELPGVVRHIRNREQEPAYEISEYLTENGYTTLYGGWNQGADIVIASDWRITGGFWEHPEDPFFFYKYLCNPEIFRADSSHCAYLFYGEENALRGVEKAKTADVDMTLIQYFPDSDVYLYTAPVNLMERFW